MYSSIAIQFINNENVILGHNDLGTIFIENVNLANYDKTKNILAKSHLDGLDDLSNIIRSYKL